MARLTQQFSEVITTQDALSKVTQVLGEVSVTQSAEARVSQVSSEIVLNMQEKTLLSGMFAEVVLIPAPLTEYKIWPQERNRININIQGQIIKL